MRVYICLSFLPLLLVNATNADTLCQNCITTYRAPGAAASVGQFRLESCPKCKNPSCKEAAEHAKEGRNKYLELRREYEALKKHLQELADARQTVPPSRRDELEALRAKLEIMEQHYDALNKKCDKEVVPDRIWEKPGLKPGESWPYGGGVGPQPGPPLGDAKPPSGPTNRDAGAANGAAGAYERAARNEQRQMDVIQGFFGAGQTGFAPSEFTPPPGVTSGGFTGGRYELTKSLGQVGRAYRQEAEKLSQRNSEPRVEKSELKKTVAPKFPSVKMPTDSAANIRDAAIAAQARLECNAYILAYLQARDLHRAALAAGDLDAARKHSGSAVECAFQAKGYAQWAADFQHKADVAHQQLLDESLAAAAKKGITIPKILETFKAKVRETGLPPHLDSAMTQAGATAEEKADAKARLLDLTPETVEAVLKERRARIDRKPEAPDAAVLDLHLFLATEAHHQMINRR